MIKAGAVIWWVCVPVGVVLLLQAVAVAVRISELRKIRRAMEEMRPMVDEFKNWAGRL